MKEKETASGSDKFIAVLYIIEILLIWGIAVLTGKSGTLLSLLMGAVVVMAVGAGSWYLMKKRWEKQDKGEKILPKLQTEPKAIPSQQSHERQEFRNSEGSENLVQTAEKLMQFMSENAVTAKALSSGIDSTNQAIEAVSEALNTISIIVGNIEEKVYSGTEVSDTLIQRANDMNSYVKNNLTRGMQTMELTKNDIETAMEGLTAMERVNEMADEILRITKQTNLLSLNASIESARAGESGKGFAVVAEEIGELAKETKSTATNIQNIIANNNESIAFVRKCFDGVMKYLEEEVTVSFRTFAEQSELYGAGVTNIKESINDIQDHIAELSDSVKGILDNVEEVNEASAYNAKGVSELTERNEHTVQMTEEIRKLLLP